MLVGDAFAQLDQILRFSDGKLATGALQVFCIVFSLLCISAVKDIFFKYIFQCSCVTWGYSYTVSSLLSFNKEVEDSETSVRNCARSSTSPVHQDTLQV